MNLDTNCFKKILSTPFNAFVCVSVLGLAAILIGGCGPKLQEPNVEVIQDMMDQPAIKAQDYSPYDREKSGMLVPPAGSWPKGMSPLLHAGNPIEAGNKLSNPHGGGSEEILALGKRHFNNYCMVCHGEGGRGDGPVADKFLGVKPPSLMTDKIRDYPDGRLYHIITYGQGVMGAYVTQMPHEKDRWAVVNYVRQLHKQTPKGN